MNEISSIRIYFKELLESISMQDKDYPIQKVQEIQNFLFTNTPKKLFRYRKFDENSISALLKDEIWASTPDHFNDPYDSYIGLDKSIFRQAIHKYFDSKVIEQHFTNDKLSNYIVEGYRSFITSSNKNHIACFSENIESLLMWGHYADAHKGFVIEYDFTELLGTCQADCNRRNKCDRFEMRYPLFPVIYSEKRFDATQYIFWHTLDVALKSNKIDIDLPNPDLLIYMKPFLYKNKTWEYEAEWRLVLESSNSKGFTCKEKIIPKAIYINTQKISDTNKFIITKVSEEKNIPLKIMAVDPFTLDYIVSEKNA